MERTNQSVESLNRRVKCNCCETTLYPGATQCSECNATDIDSDWNSLQSAYQKHDIGEAYFQGRVEQIGLHVEHWGIDKRHEDDHLIFDNKMDLRLWEPLDGQDEYPTEWPPDDFDKRVWAATEEDESINIPAIDAGGATPEPSTYNEVQWELRAIADVKTKSSKSWLGKFNLRHLAHYAEWADHFDVPVFVYMTMVDTESKSVGEEGFLAPIPSDWDWPHLLDHYDGDMRHSYGEMKDFARTCPIVKSTFRAPDGNLVIEIEDEYRYNWDWFITEVL